MMGVPTGARIWLAAGFTDLRRGFDGLSAQVQTALNENPYLCGRLEYVAADREHAARRLIG
jgi:transposase